MSFLRTVILCEQVTPLPRFYVSCGYTPFTVQVIGVNWQRPLLVRLIGEGGIACQWPLGYDMKAEISQVLFYKDWLDF